MKCGQIFNTEQVTTVKVEQVPTEDQWFEVNPQAIDQSLFLKMRISGRQEWTRQIIQEAFVEVKNNPEKYGKKFKTMMPKKTWLSKTGAEFKKLACKLGDHNADWVEQALEWAQRICNGEEWETVCDNADTANWYRLVVWKDGYMRRVGGSCNNKDNKPASYVHNYCYHSCDCIRDTVPLLIKRSNSPL